MKQPSREATSGEPTGYVLFFVHWGRERLGWYVSGCEAGMSLFLFFFLFFRSWVLRSLNQGSGVGARSLKVFHSR
jgi:hypothetical protein